MDDHRSNQSFGPELKTTTNGLEVSFSTFPFWQGVQSTPGIRKKFPFRLTAEPGQPIRQSSGPAVVQEVVDTYKSDEYGFMTPPPGWGNWADELGDQVVRDMKHLLSTLKNFQPRRIIEVGAGTTYIARQLYDYFHPERYTLIDPSLREASPEFTIIRDYFPHPQLDGQKFDLVLAFNTLEHVPDPIAFLRDLRNATNPAGYIVLIYPDTERQLLSGDPNVLIHEHLSYFTKRSTQAVADQAGLTILNMASVNDTLAVLLSPKNDHQQASPAIAVDERQLLEQCARSFENNIYKTMELVNDRLARGDRVGFHGATNALNIFLLLSGIANHPLINIYDGDKSKIGKFLPVSGTPVRAATDPTYPANAIMIVSAMSYYAGISTFALITHGIPLERMISMCFPQP